MKKIYMFCAVVLCAASMFAGSYGIAVNGKMYYAATENPNPLDASFQEYMLLGLSLNAGDQLQLWDPSANGGKGAGWAVNLDGASTTKIVKDGDHYVCEAASCFDFYIKLKYEQDQLYVGEGECGSPEGTEIGGGDDPVTPPVDPGDDDDVNYYAIGWINGEDHGEAAYDVFEDDFLFEDGKLTIECTMGSYIAVKDHRGNFYYAEGAGNATGNKVTLKWANGWTPCQKWAILQGTQYIIIRSAVFKGNIVLESVDKATYDAYHYGNHQAITTAAVSEKARKTIIDGQLRIVRGDKVYDLTGREL